jgi:hypothetical protein
MQSGTILFGGENATCRRSFGAAFGVERRGGWLHNDVVVAARFIDAVGGSVTGRRLLVVVVVTIVVVVIVVVIVVVLFAVVVAVRGVIANRLIERLVERSRRRLVRLGRQTHGRLGLFTRLHRSVEN